ncbi:MAG: malectin domain-containing carbohydrate-binding protein [Bryobacteraceae bacterium]
MLRETFCFLALLPSFSFALSDTNQAGRVQFFLRTSSEFNVYTDDPSDDTKSWIYSHCWRLQSSAPYWDSKLSWMPNTWAYINLYAIYPDSDNFKDHPEWILRDANGNMLFIPWGCANGTCPQYAGDVSNQAYRNWWISNAISKLSPGYKGVWIDDVNLDMRVSDGNGNTVIPENARIGSPMTDEDWRRYMAIFVEQIRAALPDYVILHNSIWYASPTEYQDPYVIRQIQAADYVIAERGISDPNLVSGTSPFSMGDFLNYLDAVHSNGRNILLDEFHQNGEFGLAGYYLISNGGDALGNQDVTPDNWWSGYETDLGTSLGVRSSWFGLYRRDYSGGMALLNPVNSPSVTVSLPGQFTRLDGTPVTTLTLAAGEAAVLLGTVAVNVADPVSVNCGGENVDTFMADRIGTGGQQSDLSQTVDVSGVVDAAPAEVYMTKRTSDGTAAFTYTFPNLLPNVKYTLRLHFADDQSWQTGMRQFNVSANSVQIMTNFDIFASAGVQARAVVKDYTVTANAAGNVEIVITPVIGNALLNGIEIVPIPGAGSSGEGTPSRALPSGRVGAADGDIHSPYVRFPRPLSPRIP